MAPATGASCRRVRRLVAARRRRARPDTRCQAPLTPMIDVTFQLLLFFILTTQFGRAEGNIPGTLPRPRGPSPAAGRIYKPVRVLVGSSGDGRAATYRIAGMAEANGPAELWRRFCSYRDLIGTDEAPVVIDPAAATKWRDVVEALNAAARAGFRHVGFAPQTPGGQSP